MKKIFFHILFWAISYVILYRIFTIDYHNGISDHIFTLLFHIPLIPCVYLNLWLINKWLIRRHYIRYILGITTTVMGCIYLHYLIFDQVADFIFPGYYFISYYAPLEIIQFLASYVIITMLLSMTIGWFEVKKQQLILEKENRRIQLEKLRSQINPHFLFNSLNNISALSKEDPESTRKYIITLADSLRYMIYETGEEMVPLQQEIEHITNFVALENLRLDAAYQGRIHLAGDPSEHIIAPLILLPLIENAFKHCDRDQPEIEIDIEVSPEGILNLKTKNRFDKNSGRQQDGIGLSNLAQRLQIIYGERSSLDIMEDGIWHFSHLLVNLNQSH